MNRYRELLSLYLDGEPTESELTELARLLESDTRLTENFREELFIWDVWSQETAPERSAAAFLAGLHTRLRAEADAPEFEHSVTQKLHHRLRFGWRPILALAAGLILLLSLSYFLNPADLDNGWISSAEAQTVHIHGECVCMHCTLNREARCRQAIRYTDEQGNVKIIGIARDPRFKKFNTCFCHGPTRALIEGEMIEENGEKILKATSITLEAEK
jgi:hypothetical protein